MDFSHFLVFAKTLWETLSRFLETTTNVTYECLIFKFLPPRLSRTSSKLPSEHESLSLSVKLSELLWSEVETFGRVCTNKRIVL